MERPSMKKIFPISVLMTLILLSVSIMAPPMPNPLPIVVPADQICDVTVTNERSGLILKDKTLVGGSAIFDIPDLVTGDTIRIEIGNVVRTIDYTGELIDIQYIDVICEEKPICPECPPIIECPPEKECPVIVCPICPACPTYPICPVKDSTVESMLAGLVGALAAGSTVFIYKSKKGKVTTKIK